MSAAGGAPGARGFDSSFDGTTGLGYTQRGGVISWDASNFGISTLAGTKPLKIVGATSANNTYEWQRADGTYTSPIAFTSDSPDWDTEQGGTGGLLYPSETLGDFYGVRFTAATSSSDIRLDYFLVNETILQDGVEIQADEAVVTFTDSTDFENFRVGDQTGELTKNSWTIPSSMSQGYVLNADSDLQSVPNNDLQYGFIPIDQPITTPNTTRKFKTSVIAPEGSGLSFGWMLILSEVAQAASKDDRPGFVAGGSSLGINFRVSPAFCEYHYNNVKLGDINYGFTLNQFDNIDFEIEFDNKVGTVKFTVSVVGDESKVHTETVSIPSFMTGVTYYYGVASNNYSVIYTGFSTKEIANVTAIDADTNQMVFTGGAFVVGETVKGPATEPATGVVDRAGFGLNERTIETSAITNSVIDYVPTDYTVDDTFNTSTAFEPTFVLPPAGEVRAVSAGFSFNQYPHCLSLVSTPVLLRTPTPHSKLRSTSTEVKQTVLAHL